jgi:PTS system galactitol-specific IIC component
MQELHTIVQFFLNLGGSVFIPVIIFVLALAFGAKVGKSARAALMVGVGFVGIGLVIGLLIDNLGPAAKSMVQRTGLKLSIIDVGWPASAAIAFGSEIAALIIPVGILLNLILLLTKVTRTIDVDIWNFWHFAFVGAIVQVVTGNIWLGLISAMLFFALTLFFADWTAPAVQGLLKIPGISLPHGYSATYVLPTIILNKIMDLIPGLNKVEADPETIRKRWGVLGEPVLVGAVIGLVVGALGYAGKGSFGSWFPKVLTVAISMAAVMVLLPRVVALLMEGLIPLSEAAREFLSKRASGREIYVGLDSAIAIGHPTSIATALIMVPITLLLAIILPGNRVLPFGDLATIPFMIAMMVPIVRGNVIRSTISATIIMIPTLYLENWMAPMQTQIAHTTTFKFPSGVTEITSMVDSGDWVTAMFTFVAKQAYWIGSVIILAALILVWTLYKKNRTAWERVAGAPPADDEGAPNITAV